MLLSRLYTGTRNPYMVYGRVLVDYLTDRRARFDQRLEHPGMPDLQRWVWGPDSLAKDSWFLADALLRSALSGVVDADEVEFRQPGAWEAIVEEFEEEVLCRLGDKWSMFDGEIIAWAQVRIIR